MQRDNSGPLDKLCKLQQCPLDSNIQQSKQQGSDWQLHSCDRADIVNNTNLPSWNMFQSGKRSIQSQRQYYMCHSRKALVTYSDSHN